MGEPTAGVTNAATGFDVVTDEPLYRIALGRSGTSHALRIAERLGLPPELVEAARGRIAPSASVSRTCSPRRRRPRSAPPRSARGRNCRAQGRRGLAARRGAPRHRARGGDRTRARVGLGRARAGARGRGSEPRTPGPSSRGSAVRSVRHAGSARAPSRDDPDGAREARRNATVASGAASERAARAPGARCAPPSSRCPSRRRLPPATRWCRRIRCARHHRGDRSRRGRRRWPWRPARPSPAHATAARPRRQGRCGPEQVVTLHPDPVDAPSELDVRGRTAQRREALRVFVDNAALAGRDDPRDPSRHRRDPQGRSRRAHAPPASRDVARVGLGRRRDGGAPLRLIGLAARAAAWYLTCGDAPFDRHRSARRAARGGARRGVRRRRRRRRERRYSRLVATETTAGETGDAANGEQVFTSAGCGGCHTFEAAGSTGSIGPNSTTPLRPSTRS